MFSQPDLDTLRLCGLLLNIAFAAVFLALWQGRRDDAYLAHWGASAILYAGVLTVFGLTTDRTHPLLGAALVATLIFSNLLLLSGLRQSYGQPPFRAWMPAMALAGGLLGYALPTWLLQAGWIAGPEGLPRIATTLVLMGSVILVGILLMRPGPGPTSRGCRIAGLAMLGYVPGYVLGGALELLGLDAPNYPAMVPMLSDQVLLAILYLGLLAVPGERARHLLQDAALRDPLTGAWNRSGLQAQQASMTGGGALLLLDLDHFKTINDTHGHAAGDAVLASIAARMSALVAEESGYLARIGGDEFVILLPGASSEAAEVLAQRLRGAAARGSTGLPPYTISLGLTMFSPSDAQPMAAALLRADRQLYRAKRRGRNQVASAAEAP